MSVGAPRRMPTRRAPVPAPAPPEPADGQSPRQAPAKAPRALQAVCLYCGRRVFGPSAATDPPAHPCCARWMGEHGHSRCMACGASAGLNRQYEEKQKSIAKQLRESARKARMTTTRRRPR